MIDLQFLFHVIFRLVNFVILVVLFTHVFFKYFYQDLKAQVKKQLDWWLILRDNIMHMRAKQKELDTTIAHQEWETKRLLDNMARWRLWVNGEQQRQQQQVLQRMNLLQEQSNLQEKNYKQTLLERQSLPLIFAKAHKTLADTYDHDEKKTKVFIDHMMQQIERAS